MKKKCIRFLPLLAWPAARRVLSGARRGLYAVPKQSEEYYDLQNAIELALPDGAVYAPPVSGDNQQVVQMVDLDGDGEDEAVVYCKRPVSFRSASMSLTGKTMPSRWLHPCRAQAARSTMSPYVAFDDQPGYELVVGRQISDQVPQLMNVYSCAAARWTELMSTEYAEFVTADLDADSRQEIVVLHSGGDSQNGIAELYCWADGQLKREREVSMFGCLVRQAHSDGLYVPERRSGLRRLGGDGSLITDIFVFATGVFTNLSPRRTPTPTCRPCVITTFTAATSTKTA